VVPKQIEEVVNPSARKISRFSVSRVQEQKTSTGVEEPAQGQLKIDLQVVGPGGQIQPNNSVQNGSVVNTPTEVISSPIQNVPLAINGIQLIYQQPQQIHQLPGGTSTSTSGAGAQCIVVPQVINQNGTHMHQMSNLQPQQQLVHPNIPQQPQQTPLNGHQPMVNTHQQQPQQQSIPMQPIQPQQQQNQMPLMSQQQQQIMMQQQQGSQQGSQQYNLPTTQQTHPQHQFIQTQPNQLHSLPPQVVSMAQGMPHQLPPMQTMSAQQQMISQQQHQLQMQSHMQQQNVPGMYNQQSGARVAAPQNFQGAVPNHLLQQSPLMASQQPAQPMQHVMQPIFNATSGEGKPFNILLFPQGHTIYIFLVYPQLQLPKSLYL